VVGVNREQRQLVRALRPPPIHRPSLGRAVAGWVWRHAAELLVLGLVVWAWSWSSDRLGPHETMAAALGLVLIVAGVGPVRRVVLALMWCSVSHHRLHVGLVEVRATTRDGRLPLFLSVVPAPFGERVRLWCRPGISAEDIEDESDRLRAALWCQDVRVIRDRRRSALVTVEVVRRDPLAGRPVRSALLNQLGGERGAR
jgi:hypothetical protein